MFRQFSNFIIFQFNNLDPSCCGAPYSKNFVDYESFNSDKLKLLKDQIVYIMPTFNSDKIKAYETPLVLNKHLNNTLSITSLSPTELSAGTETELIIEGSGFGGFVGTVSFLQSDDGGATQ